jgi:hypothetical protein
VKKYLISSLRSLSWKKNKTMMKKSIIYIIIFSFSILNIRGQELSEKENSLLDNFIKSRIAIEKEKIVSDTLAKVFAGTFYKINAGFTLGEGSAMCSGNLLVLKEGTLIEFDNRTDSMFTLLSLVRNDYSLKSQADAKVFETALDKIYPINWSDEGKKEHLKIDNKWYFVRGEFFDSKSAYIITLDQNSKISNIAYSMEAIKKK